MLLGLGKVLYLQWNVKGSVLSKMAKAIRSLEEAAICNRYGLLLFYFVVHTQSMVLHPFRTKVVLLLC